MIWYEGDTPTVLGTFKDPITRAPTNPPAVSLAVTPPAGFGAPFVLVYGTDAAVKNTGPGVFETVLPAVTPGVWKYGYVGTGIGSTSKTQEGEFLVIGRAS